MTYSRYSHKLDFALKEELYFSETNGTSHCMRKNKDKAWIHLLDNRHVYNPI
jgi:hypothetical protein